MIEKVFKTTNGELKVIIPTRLDEITLGQLMALQENPDLNDLEAISILSGISIEQLQNVRAMDDIQAFAGAVLSLSHQIVHLYNSDAIPKKVDFIIDNKSKRVKVLQNLSVEPAGAFMAAKEVIADEVNNYLKQYGPDDFEARFKPSLKACCNILAYYFYCTVTGNPYNEYETEHFAEEIKKLRVTEALPIAKHFFTCYPNLSKPKISYLHRLLPRWRKKREFNHLKSLNISTP